MAFLVGGGVFDDGRLQGDLGPLRGVSCARQRGRRRRAVVRSAAAQGGGSGLTGEEVVQRMREMARRESALENPMGELPSHQTVRRDDEGSPVLQRFVYVEEVDCIGCSHCAMIARNTFMLEEEHGRARAFRQDADPEAVIAEAIDTCPVNCIYYVPYDELVILEGEREGQIINPTARLVGGDAMNERKVSKSKVLSSAEMRCGNCPQRGCPKCPLYGVGDNPHYVNKLKERERKREAKKNKQDEQTRRVIL